MALKAEMEEKNRVKIQMRLKAKEDVQKEIQQADMVAEKKLQEKAIYNKKFTDFDKKYEKKNDWYQQNIILPQIEKHLTEFDKEKVYNEKYLHETISKE